MSKNIDLHFIVNQQKTNLFHFVANLRSELWFPLTRREQKIKKIVEKKSPDLLSGEVFAWLAFVSWSLWISTFSCLYRIGLSWGNCTLIVSVYPYSTFMGHDAIIANRDNQLIQMICSSSNRNRQVELSLRSISHYLLLCCCMCSRCSLIVNWVDITSALDHPQLSPIRYNRLVFLSPLSRVSVHFLVFEYRTRISQM